MQLLKVVGLASLFVMLSFAAAANAGQVSGASGGFAAAPGSAASGPAASAATIEDYKLGVSDKVRIIIYNEPNLTGEYFVNSNGQVSFPLIGDVQAQGLTTSQLAEGLAKKLGDGYLRSPQVSIDMLSFRPFYILGEVNKPGEYPYSSGLTVLNAVATAEGFTYRANHNRVFVKHQGEIREHEERLVSELPVRPGDTIRVAERYF